MSHFPFADDKLIFCKASKDQMTNLCWLLMWFEAILGLKINLDKSGFSLVGVLEDLEDLAIEIGCKISSLPSTYLGLRLGAPFKLVVAQDSVEERLKRRLVMWKGLYISKGGRLTLIRSTLASLPIYFMSLFPIPRVVRGRIEWIQRDFLWGGGALDRRPHLVKWKVVCLEKRGGGGGGGGDWGSRFYPVLTRPFLVNGVSGT